MIIGTDALSITTFRLELVRRLIQQGHKVFVLATDYSDEQKDKVIAAGGQPINYTFNCTAFNPLKDIADTLRLAKVIKKVQPDLVFIYFAKPVIFGTLATVVARAPRRIAMLEELGLTFTKGPTKQSVKIKMVKKLKFYYLSFYCHFMNE